MKITPSIPHRRGQPTGSIALTLSIRSIIFNLLRGYHTMRNTLAAEAEARCAKSPKERWIVSLGGSTKPESTDTKKITFSYASQIAPALHPSSQDARTLR